MNQSEHFSNTLGLAVLRRLGATVLLYVVFAAFVAEDITAIGIAPKEIPRLYLFSVPVRDVGLLVALSYSALRYRHLLRIAGGPWLALVVFVFFFGLLQAVLTTGISNALNYDIRVFLWLFGGIGFAMLMQRTRCTRTHLKVLLVASTVLMGCASVFSPDFYEYTLTGGATRVAHPSLYAFGGLLVVPLVLLVNSSGRRLSGKLLPAVCLAAYFGFAALLSGTRSSLLITALLVWTLLTSLRFRFVSGGISVGKATGLARMFVVVLALMGAALLPGLISNYRGDRFASLLEPETLLTDSRVFELLDFFTSSSAEQLLLGRGVGGGIPSSIYFGEFTGIMHVGIANVWMKFGLLPFVVAVAYLLFFVPYRYLKSLRRARDRRRQPTLQDTANILILPALFPWILSLLISGGYSESNLFMAGFVLYAYRLTKRYGIEAFFPDAPPIRARERRSYPRITRIANSERIPR